MLAKSSCAHLRSMAMQVRISVTLREFLSTIANEDSPNAKLHSLRILLAGRLVAKSGKAVASYHAKKGNGAGDAMWSKLKRTFACWSRQP